MPRVLAFAIAVLLSLGSADRAQATVFPATAEDIAAENELLTAINQSREQAGIAAVRPNQTLHAAALAHAALVVENLRLEHQLGGELDLLQRIAAVAVPGDTIGELAVGATDHGLRIDLAGENLGDATRPAEISDDLMRSAPHRAILLGSEFNIVGIAAIWGHGRLWVVQDFAHEIATYSVRQTEALVSRSIQETRRQAGLGDLTDVETSALDNSACALADETRPHASLLAAGYQNRKTITYAQSDPTVLPAAALPLLRAREIRRFAVGSCYARNARYPTGTYWVAILLF